VSFQRLSPRTSLLRTNPPPPPPPRRPRGPELSGRRPAGDTDASRAARSKEGRGGVVLAVRAAVTNSLRTLLTKPYFFRKPPSDKSPLLGRKKSRWRSKTERRKATTSTDEEHKHLLKLKTKKNARRRLSKGVASAEKHKKKKTKEGKKKKHKLEREAKVT
ncbi:unnamed protein product, partial [Rangifer tarandus platyrhynchus]